MGKYDPLDRFFAELEGDEYAWTFDEFERLTGVKLPPSARRHQVWWSGAGTRPVWRDHGWHASPRFGRGEIRFSRTPSGRGRPVGSGRVPAARAPRSPNRMPEPPGDLILLGCVAQKHPGPAPAKYLYSSPLWQRRRQYAGASGRPWAILSAEFGLLEPERVIPYYDRYLERESTEYRQAWSEQVAAEVVAKAEEVGARSVEIHAGAAYIESGLRRHLEAAGLRVLRPLEGMRIGEQLAWYGGLLPTSGAEATPPPTVTPLALVGSEEPSPSHVRLLAQTYRSEVLGESWEHLPEAWHRPKTDPRSARLWVTFVACVDRARDAERLWSAAQRAWQDQPWIFEPEEVATRPLHQLMEVLRHYGVSQRHSVDGAAWRLIAEALVSPVCPAPVRQAIDGEEVAADAVLQAVSATWPDGSPMFPLLSGPKISPMWVRMLVFPGGARITCLEIIPVAVDTHVQRVTEMLGLVPVRPLDDAHRTRIQQVWFDAVRLAGLYGGPGSLDGTAAGIDPALWALGRMGCSRCEQQGNKIPVGPICDLCVLGRIPPRS